jgi:hypothetical protein
LAAKKQVTSFQRQRQCSDVIYLAPRGASMTCSSRRGLARRSYAARGIVRDRGERRDDTADGDDQRCQRQHCPRRAGSAEASNHSRRARCSALPRAAELACERRTHRPPAF